MRIFFDARLVGSRSDFIWADGEIHIEPARDDDWKFHISDKRKMCVKAASEAAGCNLEIKPNIPAASFWMKHTQHPAWSMIMQKRDFTAHLRNQIDAVVSFLENLDNRYFLTHFQVQQSLIDYLAPSRIADGSLSDSGFIPDAQGFVPVPRYDNHSSSTGRMSIVSGPRILTLPKEQRKKIASRWKDGVILEIDFNALEARVLSWMAGNEQAEGDLYETIGRRSGLTGISRGVIKEATLAAIYGMSRRNFALRYQDMPDAIDVYEKVRKTMKVNELDRDLAGKKAFTNAFGRPLEQTSARISHYVQSSAVDVACHGFSSLIASIDPASAVPIFLIHDAIILDVKRDYINAIEDACKYGLAISIMNQNLPVKVRRISDE